MTETRIVFGAAGTGKTSFILEEIENSFSEPDWDSFCYVTYTKAAAEDFKRRIREKFNLDENTVKSLYVGTQHSLCYRLAGFQNIKFVEEYDKKAFFALKDIDYEIALFQKVIDVEAMQMTSGDVLASVEAKPLGNKIMSIFSACRMGMRDPNQNELLLLEGEGCSLEKYQEVVDEWREHKQNSELFDFEDILEIALYKKLFPPVKRLFADEFQDFGKLQYEVYNVWKEHCEKVLVAGDENQVLYSYISADPTFMLNEPGERIILTKNHRSLQRLYDFAAQVVRPNTQRVDKQIICARGSGPDDCIKVYSWSKPELSEQLTNIAKSDQKIFMLVRSNRYVQELENMLAEKVIPFRGVKANRSHWDSNFINFLNACHKISQDENQLIGCEEYWEFFDKAPRILLNHGAKKEILKMMDPQPFSFFKERYFRVKKFELSRLFKSCMINLTTFQRNIFESIITRNSFRNFDKNIKLYVGTIHASKGLECDHCYLFDSVPLKVQVALNDEAEQASRETFLPRLEEERRVYYVAMTRPRDELTIVLDCFNKTSFLKNQRLIEVE